MRYLEFLKNCNFDETSVIIEVGAGSCDHTYNILGGTNGATIYSFEHNLHKILAVHDSDPGRIPNVINRHISNVDGDYHEVKGTDKFIKTICLDTFTKVWGIKSVNFMCIYTPESLDKIVEGAKNILKTTEYVYLRFIDGINNNVMDLLPGEWMVRMHYGSDVLLENITYRDTLISDSGFWKIKNLNEHVFDENLAFSLVNYMHEEGVSTCYDFGCGPGKYTEYFNYNGISTEGFDGNPYTPELTGGRCKVLDLTSDFNMDQRDCVLTLEVGEHIPFVYQHKFIDNVVKHAGRFVILSWGVVGQGGYGHVNCQENDYIKHLFMDRGFYNKMYIENMIRAAADSTWFKNTIMVFKRTD